MFNQRRPIFVLITIARRGQHLCGRPQNESACCKMKADFLNISLTLLLLCYAPLPIHSHGVNLLTGHGCPIFFPDPAAQTFLSHGETKCLCPSYRDAEYITCCMCPVCFATMLWAILPLLRHMIVCRQTLQGCSSPPKICL